MQRMAYHPPFDNSYARLPDRFFARVDPMRSPEPRLLRMNLKLAEDLGLDTEWLSGPEGLEWLSGRLISEGSEPIAQAYAGHQFGNFTPQLGDGRAILLGEVVDRNGKRRDIQLKGSGRTPYSRGGDGRAGIGPVLREYIVSEAMAALGIPTTRSLAAIATGDQIYREQPTDGAVLTRIASSHIRIGTFQFFASRGDTEGVRLLADHVIARHYPDAADAPNPYRALLDRVVAAQAKLIARWLHVGFIHGVMNTDNMSVAGETIDYGPCAFIDDYDPAKVFSSIDRAGRYAYGNQPNIGLWNLTRLAETLLPLFDEDETAAIATAQDSLCAFATLFEGAYEAGLRAKLGLATAEPGDAELSAELLGTMRENLVDFTLFFRRLSAAQGSEPVEALRGLFVDPTACDARLASWHARLARDPQSPDERRAAMDAVNPAYIPRNHRVEAALRAAEQGDLAPFEALVAVLADPYRDQPGREAFADPPLPDERVLRTFCGT
jgi:uncharacterized protein YdiU (UPF0061 family)